MTPPRAVVFDLGKVLLDFDYRIAIHRLLPRIRIGPRQVQQLIDQSPLLLEYEGGRISTREFFERVQASTGFSGSLEEFGAVFGDIFTEIEPMIALHAELHRRGVPTFIFSNTNELAVEHIRARFPFFSRFNGHVLSYEVQALKPAPAIYQALEALAGRAGSDLFYLDDRPENVEAARRRGWRGWVHTSPETSRHAVAETGLLA